MYQLNPYTIQLFEWLHEKFQALFFLLQKIET